MVKYYCPQFSIVNKYQHENRGHSFKSLPAERWLLKAHTVYTSRDATGTAYCAHDLRIRYKIGDIAALWCQLILLCHECSSMSLRWGNLDKTGENYLISSEAWWFDTSFDQIWFLSFVLNTCFWIPWRCHPKVSWFLLIWRAEKSSRAEVGMKEACFAWLQVPPASQSQPSYRQAIIRGGRCKRRKFAVMASVTVRDAQLRFRMMTGSSDVISICPWNLDHVKIEDIQ